MAWKWICTFFPRRFMWCLANLDKPCVEFGTIQGRQPETTVWNRPFTATRRRHHPQQYAYCGPMFEVWIGLRSSVHVASFVTFLDHIATSIHVYELYQLLPFPLRMRRQPLRRFNPFHRNTSKIGAPQSHHGAPSERDGHERQPLHQCSRSLSLCQPICHVVSSQASVFSLFPQSSVRPTSGNARCQ